MTHLALYVCCASVVLLVVAAGVVLTIGLMRAAKQGDIGPGGPR